MNPTAFSADVGSVSLGAFPTSLAETSSRVVRSALTWPARSRRVFLLLVCIWLLNAFDLLCTLGEARQRLFHELNPMAAQLLAHPPAALLAYKTSLVFIGSFILFAHRRQRLAELSCWLILAVYGYVTLRWTMYYDDLALALNDPAVYHIEVDRPAHRAHAGGDALLFSHPPTRP